MRVALEIEETVEAPCQVITVGNDLLDQFDGPGVVLPARPNAEAMATRGVGGGNAGEDRECGRHFGEVDAIVLARTRGDDEVAGSSAEVAPTTIRPASMAGSVRLDHGPWRGLREVSAPRGFPADSAPVHPGPMAPTATSAGMGARTDRRGSGDGPPARERGRPCARQALTACSAD